MMPGRQDPSRVVHDRVSSAALLLSVERFVDSEEAKLHGHEVRDFCSAGTPPFVKPDGQSHDDRPPLLFTQRAEKIDVRIGDRWCFTRWIGRNEHIITF